MKKLNTSRTLLSVALMGAFAVAPFMAPTAQADPPSHAPAYGWRAKNKNKKNKKDERRDRNNRNDVSYRGTVTNVRSGNSFDLSANGRTYNVYTSARLPRGLNRGDEVRVSGRPYGDNDIRSATVRVTDNNSNDPRRDDDDNNYQSFRGTVTNVRNSREFDIRVGGTTYNVYANNSARNLDRDDEVRVYGLRSGSNDIRNASVSVTRNR